MPWRDLLNALCIDCVTDHSLCHIERWERGMLYTFNAPMVLCRQVKKDRKM